MSLVTSTAKILHRVSAKGAAHHIDRSIPGVTTLTTPNIASMQKSSDPRRQVHYHTTPLSGDAKRNSKRREINHGAQHYDLQKTLKHLINTTPSTLATLAGQSQMDAGYNVDKWEMTTLGEILDTKCSYSTRAAGLIVQSLVFGPKSIINSENWDPSLHPLSPEALELAADKFKKKQIPGASTYFTPVTTFEQANRKLTGNNEHHYHGLTQVDFPRCTQTGDPLFGHRQHLGVFNVPTWMSALPIAVSNATENKTRAIQTPNGQTQVVVGLGGARQFYTTSQTLAALHYHVSRVISQQDEFHGVSKARRCDILGRIRWEMFGSPATNPASVIEVCPQGVAVEKDSGTAPKAKL